MPLEVIKVCGITRVDDALAAVGAGATAIGLNFYPGSPRYVNFGQAAIIAAVVPKSVWKVGVFVDETSDRIRETARAVGLDVIQLHGAETPHDCEVLDPLPVWKAFRVADGFDFRLLADYKVQALVLDAVAGELLGGSGQTFPWKLAREAARYGRVIIAGGLDASNVADAIRTGDPWGVDASSRLERSQGVKDPAKVRAFVQAARAGATQPA